MLFYENVAALVRQSLPAQGAVRLPWGGRNTVLPLVAGEDVARVDAGLLTGPELKAGTACPTVLWQQFSAAPPQSADRLPRAEPLGMLAARRSRTTHL